MSLALDRLSLLADPALRGDPAYLGHMLNDGATCTSEALRPAYVAAANAARNVEQRMLEGCHMAVVATRDPSPSPGPGPSPDADPNPNPSPTLTRWRRATLNLALALALTLTLTLTLALP